jgi:hypothetical protein
MRQACLIATALFLSTLGARGAADLDLSGFAFDTADGTARYAGPALPTLAHRAWDEEIGAYCSEAVAIPHLIDFVHTLKKDGRTLGVVANVGSVSSYAACFHCDAAMHARIAAIRQRTRGSRPAPSPTRWPGSRRSGVEAGPEDMRLVGGLRP